jgi:ankyrin repeat protein
MQTQSNEITSEIEEELLDTSLTSPSKPEISEEQEELATYIANEIFKYLHAKSILPRDIATNPNLEIFHQKLRNGLFLEGENACEFTLEEISKIDLNDLVVVFNYHNIANNPFNYFEKENFIRWIKNKSSYPNRNAINWDSDLVIIFKNCIDEDGNKKIQTFFITVQEFKDLFSGNPIERKNKIIEYILTSKHKMILRLIDNEIIKLDLTPNDADLFLKKLFAIDDIPSEIFDLLKKSNVKINRQDLEINFLMKYLTKKSRNVVKLLPKFDDVISSEISSINPYSIISRFYIYKLIRQTNDSEIFNFRLISLYLDINIDSLFTADRTNIAKLITSCLIKAIKQSDYPSIQIFLNREYFTNDFYHDYLVRNNFSQEDNILLTALDTNDSRIIKMLLEKGINTKDIFDCYGNDALGMAVKKGNIEIVKLLLNGDYIANINNENISRETPYLMALKYSHDKIASLLKEKINPHDLIQSSYRLLLKLPITTSTEYRESVNFAEKIIDSIPNDESLQNIKNNVIIIASKYRNHEMVKMLIRKGADVNAIDSNGFSALQYAVKYNYLNIASTLLAKGASINYASPNNDPAIIYALKNQNPDMLNELLKYQPDQEIIIPRIKLQRRCMMSLIRSPQYSISLKESNQKPETSTKIENEKIKEFLKQLFKHHLARHNKIAPYPNSIRQSVGAELVYRNEPNLQQIPR